MKRLHIHLAVDDLEKNVAFYTALFAASPTRREADYAKWKLDDPRLNFAISARGRTAGLDHLGLQVESDSELAEVHQRLADAALPLAEQRQAACCYVKSNKYWTVDPQGVPWEAFHTLTTIPLFGEDSVIELSPNPNCCQPTDKGDTK